jgi:hypothetical protein
MKRLTVLLLQLLLAASMQADVLVLKNGDVVIGTLQSQGDAGYRVQRGKANPAFPLDTVALVFTNATRADAEVNLPAWGP